MKKKKFRVSRKLKKQIPIGMYCYVFTGKSYPFMKDGVEVTAFQTKCCPKYFHNKFGYGDCCLLSPPYNGENDNVDFCLDDQCKSCGINYKWSRRPRKRRSSKHLIFKKNIKKRSFFS